MVVVVEQAGTSTQLECTRVFKETENNKMIVYNIKEAYGVIRKHSFSQTGIEKKLINYTYAILTGH